MADLKTTLDRLREIDYTALDYETLQEELINYIRSAQSAEGIDGDFLEGDAAKVFIDLFSYLGEILSFRIDTLAQESFLPTANRRQSIINLLELVGIKPINSTAAQVTLVAIPERVSSTDIIIPARTQIQTTGLDGNNVTFEIMNSPTDYYNDVVLPGGLTNYLVKAYSGTYDFIRIESTGEPNYKVTLPNFPVIDGSIKVSVSPLPTTDLTPEEIESTRIKEVESIVTSEPGFIYVVRYDDIGRATLTFASERFGRIPPRGWTIHIDYRYGGGANSNVSEGAINTNTAFRNLAGEYINVRLANPDTKASGGSDPEDIDTLKLKAPLLVQANDNLVTVDDYVGIIKNIPGVTDVFVVDAYTDYNTYGSKFGVPDNSVFIWILPETLGEISPDLRQIIYTELYKRRLVAIQNYVFDPKFKDWDLSATVKVLDGYDKLSVKAAVEDAIKNKYSGTALKFNTTVRVSQIIATIQTVEGVDYVSLTSPSADVTAEENEVLRLLPNRITITVQ